MNDIPNTSGKVDLLFLDNGCVFRTEPVIGWRDGGKRALTLQGTYYVHGPEVVAVLFHLTHQMLWRRGWFPFESVNGATMRISLAHMHEEGHFKTPHDAPCGESRTLRCVK